MTHDQVVTLLVFGGVIVTVFVMLAIYDVWLLVSKGPEATFSRSGLEIASKYPILPFAIGLIFGVIVGHMLWENCA